MDHHRPMTIPPFDWPSVEPGEIVRAGVAGEIPVIAIRGAHPGKTLVVSAGVHGDEFEGVQAIFDVVGNLDPAVVHGSVIAVPVVNPPAFWNCTRTSPLDGANLARVFPGDPHGTPTQAIAWHFDQQILAHADFYLDLHSAGVKWLMPTMVGYHASDLPAMRAAEVFGAPVVWCHPSIAPGRTVSAAAARGIPALYAEARGGGRIHPDDLAVYRRGLFQLLHHLSILKGALERVTEPIRLYGDGNIDRGITATERGFLTPLVELLQPVDEGQPLGILRDLWGNEVAQFRAPGKGVVALIHACPMVQPGEPLFLLTDKVG
jgi:predicted deacylase